MTYKEDLAAQRVMEAATEQKDYATYYTSDGVQTGISQEEFYAIGHIKHTMADIEFRAWRAKRNAGTTGRKDDGDKARMDLIPPEAVTALATVLTFGAKKYADRNWELGMKWGRPFAACMRHLWSWWRGEKADPDTGNSHLWHAFCCIAFLITYEARGAGEDDRYRG